MNAAVWVPIVVAIIAPLGAYLLAARKMSGRVATSDATALWKESASIRDDYRGQLAIAAARIQNLEVRIVSLEGVIDTITEANLALRAKVIELEKALGNGR